MSGVSCCAGDGLADAVALGPSVGKANVADGEGDGASDGVSVGDGVGLGLGVGVGVGGGGIIFSQ